jgi:hypothetical protein
MIIAFYPGAGGNRYLQMLSGKDWTKHRVSYDFKNHQEIAHRYLLTDSSTLQSGHILTHCMNSDLIRKKLSAQDIVFIKSNCKSSLRREWMLHGYDRYMNTVDHNTLSRIEHYNAIKDPTWPEINSLSMLECLPGNILQEVNKDYESLSHKITNPQTKIEQLTQECVTKIQSAWENIVWHKNYYTQYPEDFALAKHVIDIDQDQNEFATFMRQELGLYHSEFYDKAWSAIYE